VNFTEPLIETPLERTPPEDRPLVPAPVGAVGAVDPVDSVFGVGVNICI
jgi:hypothetical protein